MASPQIKMPAKSESKKEAADAAPERKRSENDRYLLQVDRQTKGSYLTEESAKKAAMAIKAKHPILQVAVYDTVEKTRMTVGGTASPSQS